MLIVYINTVTQKEQRNVCQTSTMKNRGTHPHKVNRFEPLAILASDLSLSNDYTFSGTGEELRLFFLPASTEVSTIQEMV